MRFDWRQLLIAYQRLSPRERLLSGLAVGAVFVVLFYSLIWAPLIDSRAELRRRSAVKRQELIEIQRMRHAYLDLLVKLEAGQRVIATFDKNFSLFSHIEGIVSQVIKRERIDSMKPNTKTIGDTYREDSVRLKLKQVTLPQLVDMLYRIEKGNQPLRVTRLTIKKRFRNRYSFDVDATVSMLNEAQS